jgi:hypothetical protein
MVSQIVYTSRRSGRKIFIAKKKKKGLSVHGKQNAIAVWHFTNYVVVDVCLFLHVWVKESKKVEEDGVSCDLLVAKHGLNHLITADGEDGEERVTQLRK